MLNLKFATFSLLLTNIIANPVDPNTPAGLAEKVKESKLKAIFDQPKVVKSSTTTHPNSNSQQNEDLNQKYEKMTDIPEVKFDVNEMLCLLNVERALAKVPAPPLTISKELSRIALAHSQDQAFHNKMSHESSNGDKLMDRIKKNNCAGLAFGENVAWNQVTVEEVVKAWANSDGHYANIINPKYCEVGASKANTYWTQVFGASCPKDNVVPNCKGYEKRTSLRTK